MANHAVSSREYAIFGAESASLSPGAHFGPAERYEVSSELGRGSTAVVFLVRDTKLAFEAAAKVLFRRDGETADGVLRRARAEANTLRKLDHENIARAYDTGPCGENAYVLLEYQDGIGLDEALEAGPLPVDRALDVALQLARALEHAHEAAVLHLDLKPGNVWMTADGRAKLLDFGFEAELAEARESPGSALVTGTPAYMAPEQWRLMIPDARADVWSLGVTLYELLTGELPFAASGTHPILLCDAVVSSKSPPPLAARLGVPARLDALLQRALANERAERYQTAFEFRRALEEVVRDGAVRPGYCPSSTRARRISATAVA